MRKSPSNAQLRLAITVCDQGRLPELSPDSAGCVLAGSLIKHFLRSLPDGVLPSNLEPTLDALLKEHVCRLILLVHLLQLLTHLVSSPLTLMSIDAMAKVIGPNLIVVQDGTTSDDGMSSASSLSDEMKRISAGVHLANWMLTEWRRGPLREALQKYLIDTS
jgi:hypothetical protein